MITRCISKYILCISFFLFEYRIFLYINLNIKCNIILHLRKIFAGNILQAETPKIRNI